MADTGDQLLREVEEDLQREQWLRLWNTYGRYAVTAIVLVIVMAYDAGCSFCCGYLCVCGAFV